jgi:hypothetical protein
MVITDRVLEAENCPGCIGYAVPVEARVAVIFGGVWSLAFKVSDGLIYFGVGEWFHFLILSLMGLRLACCESKSRSI